MNLDRNTELDHLVTAFAALPLFYSKVIPASLGMFAEGTVLPNEKNIGTIHKKKEISTNK